MSECCMREFVDLWSDMCVGMYDVTCAMSIVWQCFGGSYKGEKHCTLGACHVCAKCVCIYSAV